MGTSETIYPGQKLKLEGSSKKAATTVAPNKTVNKVEKKSTPKNKNSRIHVVQKGESLWDISKKYKVSIDDLVKWNELEGTRIRAGQNIYVEPQF